MPLRRFEDKVVLLTGAATGIGQATAVRLAREGARLWLVDVNDEALAATGGDALDAGSPGVACRGTDVSDETSVESSVADCVKQFGRLDALVNSAGIIHYGHFHEHTLDVWNKILAVNLTGTFLMCRAAIPHLIESQGAIVNLASNAALAGHAWMGAYTASKGGVHSLTKMLAVEYGKQGVRANIVSPAGIETGMSKKFELPDGGDASLLKRISCLGNITGTPEDVAGLIAFLASEDAAHVNGEYVRVDGATIS